MKNWQKGTALFIAVFLLIFIGGCYTTLRSPTHFTDAVVSETQYEQSEWNFGRGWNYQSYGVGSNYFYFHSMPWWYNRHRDYVSDTISTANDTSGNVDGKVTRRNFDDPYQGDAALNFQPNIPRDSLNAANPPATPPDSIIKPPTNMTGDKNKENSNTEKKNNSDKVNHRSRR